MSPTVSSDRSTPAALRAAWIAAIRARDAELLRPLLTDDYEVWANATAPLRGVDATIAAMGAAFARYEIAQSFDAMETIVAGDWAFERGIEQMIVTHRDDGSVQVLRQRALLILRRGPDQHWQYARGMTNALPPEPSSISPANEA